MPMMQAMKGWVAEHRQSGKLVDVWSFAGQTGGGGVVEVDSHEELDEIMSGFPFGPFSDVTVYALSDLDRALDTAERAMAQMMEAMGG